MASGVVQEPIVISGNVGVTGSVPVTGPLTDAQLRATPVPISGSISATNPSVSTTDSAIPTSGTMIAGSDGTNLKAVKVSTAGVVSVDGSAVTQPISGSISVSNLPATQVVSIASMPSTPVTGTFFQATQPVSGTVTATGPLTDTQLRASAVPVSGTFFQATQPVSGTVTANAGLGTMATSLATLPALTAGSAVIGKVSIDQTTPGTTNLVSIGTNGTVAVTNLDVALSTRLKPADTLAGVTTVAAVTAITNALPTGANTIGAVTNANLDVALSTRLKPADTLAAVTTVTTVGAVTAITNALPIGANKIGTVDIATAAATAKGTQGANGVPTQDLKDSGRNQTNYYMAIQIVSTSSDALLALTGYKSGALVAATTTPAVVTSGKTYRITSITLTYVTIVTTPGAIRFTLRANLSGVVAITSPIVMNWTVGEPTGIAPVAGKFNTVAIPLPDGMEFAAGTGIGISQVGLNTVGTAAAVGYGIVSITGFEY